MGSVSNYFTVDFEDWYQGLTSTQRDVDRWSEYEPRVDVGGHYLLDVLRARGVRATFFVVGRVAEEHPELVRRIATEGHEIGLHGNVHQRVDEMSRDTFAADLAHNLRAVRDVAGVEPVGYRAPCWSFPAQPWFYEQLAEAGLRYDSSVFPIRTPLYGAPDQPREPHAVDTPHGAVLEFPMTTVDVAGVNLPFSGGFYFRALPYAALTWAFRRLNQRGRGVVFYCHPWEFDPDHPRPPSTTMRERLSHYGFLRGSRAKLERLLTDFRFAPLGELDQYS